MAILNPKTWRTDPAKPATVERKWVLLDATDVSLGHVAVQAAVLLRGKHKPTFSPHVDCGDFVVVVNAAKVRLTGAKLTDKKYYHHSGYPGGLKTRRAGDIKAKRPAELVWRAVRGMLPKGTLGRTSLRKLKVYAGPTHPHAAQAPVAMEVPS